MMRESACHHAFNVGQRRETNSLKAAPVPGYTPRCWTSGGISGDLFGKRDGKQHPDFSGRISVTGWKKRKGKQADKNIKEY